MASFAQRAIKQNLVRPPHFLEHNLHYEVMMGSRAYGVNSSESTDYDIYGFCIPPREVLFPHLAGIIPGFGDQGYRFEQWQQHHINDPASAKEYDFSIYNIVKYFQLCMDNNPNMIDSLFVPESCVLHCTSIGHMVRDKRKLFLSRRVWNKFKGYAYGQLHKLDNKVPTGKRKESVDTFGYDVKYAYHIVRLMNECYQILTEGDLDLQRSREELKSIRRGEWTEERLRLHFEKQLPTLEEARDKSTLPNDPDESKIKKLLLECLEAHYGSLAGVVHEPELAVKAIKEIEDIARKTMRVLGV